MKRGMWIGGGLVLSLGGWASQLVAQDAGRPIAYGQIPVAQVVPAPRPLPTLIPASELAPLTGPGVTSQAGLARGVSLGRPLPLGVRKPVGLPIMPVSDSQPIPVIGSSLHPTSPPRRTAPLLPAVDSGQPESEEDSEFAADRVVDEPLAEKGPDIHVAWTSTRKDPPPPTPPEPSPPDPSTMAPAGARPTLNEDGSICADQNFYASAEYLLWTTRKDHVPPLAITGNLQNNRSLDPSSVRALFGGALDRDPRNGGRLTVGYWLDMWNGQALEASGFFLPGRRVKVLVTSADVPFLARPYFSLNRRAEMAEVVASPQQGGGSIRVDAPSIFWGADLNIRWKVCEEGDFHVDLLGGARYLNLEESLNIADNHMGLPSGANQLVRVSDFFAARNSFLGAQMGADAEWRIGRWFYGAKGQLGLGATFQEVRADGSRQLANPNRTVPGGLLVLSSNSGSRRQGDFAVVPEIGLTMGYQVTDNLRAFVGYNFLYWSSVVRPGDQIDRTLDETLLPNPPGGVAPAGRNRPVLMFKPTDFWAQGLNLGAEYRY